MSQPDPEKKTIASAGELMRPATRRSFVRMFAVGGTMLDGIDNALIPNAQNAELKALLEQTRPAVAAHLQHAQELQASVGKS